MECNLSTSLLVDNASLVRPGLARSCSVRATSHVAGIADTDFMSPPGMGRPSHSFLPRLRFCSSIAGAVTGTGEGVPRSTGEFTEWPPLQIALMSESYCDGKSGRSRLTALLRAPLRSAPSGVYATRGGVRLEGRWCSDVG